MNGCGSKTPSQRLGSRRQRSRVRFEITKVTASRVVRGDAFQRPNHDSARMVLIRINSYWMSKLPLHAVYRKMWSAYLEGRSRPRSPAINGFGTPMSLAVAATAGKQGGTVPEADGNPPFRNFPLFPSSLCHLGNPKDFPLSVKVGRQELSYGEKNV